MDRSFSIRPPTAADAAAVARMWRHAITLSCVGDHENDPAILAAWTADKTGAGLAVAFAEDGPSWRAAFDAAGIPLAIGMIREGGEVCALYVDPARAGEGIGSRVLLALETLAAEREWPVLTLESTAAAREFYRTRGFRDAGAPVVRFGVTAFPMRKAMPGDPGS